MTIIVVGAGVSGVFSALYARRLRPDARILLVDQDTAIGGLLRSDRHPNGLDFDRGTHVLSWTGEEVIDDILFRDLPEVSWNRFVGPGRDLSGRFHDTHIAEDSPCLPVETTLFEAQEPATRHGAHASLPAPGSMTLGNYLRGRFGPVIAERVFAAPIHNLYDRAIDDLDVFVAGQLPLSRIIAHTFDDWLKRASDAAFRSVAACPDQRRLPSAYVNMLPTHYPRRMGIGQLFDHLTVKLQAAGIELRLRHQIADFGISDGCVQQVTLVDDAGQRDALHGPVNVIWCSPPFALASTLGRAALLPRLERGWRTTIIDAMVNLRGPLSCFYYVDYGPNPFFRVTNYAALAPEQWAKGPYPLTFEFWNREDDFDDAVAHEAVSSRLLALSLIGSRADVSDIRQRTAQHSTLFATHANIVALGAFARDLAAILPRNLLNVGLLSEPGLFFTRDVLTNAAVRIRQTFQP